MPALWKSKPRTLIVSRFETVRSGIAFVMDFVMLERKSMILATGLVMLCHGLAVPLLAHAEKGFWTIRTVPNAPKILAQIAKSVLMVEVPSGTDVAIDLIRNPSIESALANFEDHATLTEAETILRKRQLGRCFAKKAKVCTLHSSFELGTAFMVENTRSFVSAYHVFRDVLRGNRQNRIDMVLQDADGHIVFGRSDDDRTRIAFAAPEAVEAKSVTPQSVDCILLKTSRPILGSMPLPISDEATTRPGSVVFSIGYPGATYDRAAKLGRPDSDGVSLYVTFGQVLGLHEALRRNKKDPANMSSDRLEALGENLLISDADSYFGMSGGPTINAKGEVIGIVVGSFPVDGAADALSESFSMRPVWMHALMSRGH
jgi:S1-C subfamily serine protease